MKKFLSSLGRSRRREYSPYPNETQILIYAVLATEPLRVGLIDLLDADTKGKWWLVGAGWSGDPLMDRKGQRSATKPRGDVHYETEEKLLEVARAQGMNTDVRRSIFVVLMTSEVDSDSFTPIYPS
jgi:nucleolar MIF4G domain-containing protein 1